MKARISHKAYKWGTFGNILQSERLIQHAWSEMDEVSAVACKPQETSLRTIVDDIAPDI